jgi:hypothetical protein
MPPTIRQRIIEAARRLDAKGFWVLPLMNGKEPFLDRWQLERHPLDLAVLHGAMGGARLYLLGVAIATQQKPNKRPCPRKHR